jgi:phospholipid transport system transporter-binding protein
MIVKAEGWVRINGPVTLAQSARLLEEGLKLFEDEAPSLDFSGVKEMDSSIIALIFAWARILRARNQTLRLGGLPENLKNLAGLYGVLEVIEKYHTS